MMFRVIMVMMVDSNDSSRIRILTFIITLI